MSSDYDRDDYYWDCPSCNTPLLKTKSRTGQFCHACGVQLRVRVYENQTYDQETISAGIAGFIKGFLIAGAIGFLFSHGIMFGLVWGSIWGMVRYFTGTPSSLSGQEYLDRFY